MTTTSQIPAVCQRIPVCVCVCVCVELSIWATTLKSWCKKTWCTIKQHISNTLATHKQHISNTWYTINHTGDNVPSESSITMQKVTWWGKINTTKQAWLPPWGHRQTVSYSQPLDTGQLYTPPASPLGSRFQLASASLPWHLPPCNLTQVRLLCSCAISSRSSQLYRLPTSVALPLAPNSSRLAPPRHPVCMHAREKTATGTHEVCVCARALWTYMHACTDAYAPCVLRLSLSVCVCEMHVCHTYTAIEHQRPNCPPQKLEEASLVCAPIQR